MITHPARSRLEVIATGRRGILVGVAADGFLRVILDGVDDVTEFPTDELVFLPSD